MKLTRQELEKYFNVKPAIIKGAVDIMKVIFSEGVLDNLDDDEDTAITLKDSVQLSFHNLYQLFLVIQEQKGEISLPCTISGNEIEDNESFEKFVNKIISDLDNNCLEAYHQELEKRKAQGKKFKAAEIVLDLDAGKGVKSIKNDTYQLDELIGALLLVVLNSAPVPAAVVKPKTMIIPFFSSFKTEKGNLQLVFDYENGQAIAANAYNALSEAKGIYFQGKVVVLCEGNTLIFLPVARGATAGCVDKFLDLYEVKENTRAKFAAFKTAMQKPATSQLQTMHDDLLIDKIKFERQIEEKAPSNPVKSSVGWPLPPLPSKTAIAGGKAQGVMPPIVPQVAASPGKPPVAMSALPAPIKKPEEAKDKGEIKVTFPKHFAFGNYGIAIRFDNEETAEAVRYLLQSKEAKQEGDQLIFSYKACQNGAPWLTELLLVYRYRSSKQENLNFLNSIIKTFLSGHEGKFTQLTTEQLQASTMSAQRPWKLLHDAHIPFMTQSPASRKSAVNPNKISFVTKGEFKNSGAILSFMTKGQVAAALRTLENRCKLQIDQKYVYTRDEQIIFTPLGCKEGYVGKLLSLFEYPDRDTRHAISFLIQEVAKSEDFFGGGRASKCNSALSRVLQQSKYIEIGVYLTQFEAHLQYIP